MIIQRRQLILGAGLVAAQASLAPAFAQPPAEPPAAQPPAVPDPGPPPLAPGKVRVALNSAAGTILIDLEQEKAPITAGNFLRYVDQRRYDGVNFYRAARPPGATTYDNGVIQGGLDTNAARMLPAIKHEPTTETGLKHVDGTISMGRNAPGTARSEFFICIGESSYLDANPANPGDNLGYSAFGQVVQGMDVVKKILAMPVHPTRGPMVGQMLDPKVPITNIRRVAA